MDDPEEDEENSLSTEEGSSKQVGPQTLPLMCVGTTSCPGPSFTRNSCPSRDWPGGGTQATPRTSLVEAC